jgi:hypothetical protein
MTTPADKLRAIVEGRRDFTIIGAFIGGTAPTPRERILSQTLLAVLERCNEGADYLTVARERESIADLITTKLKEAWGL